MQKNHINKLMSPLEFILNKIINRLCLNYCVKKISQRNKGSQLRVTGGAISKFKKLKNV